MRRTIENDVNTALNKLAELAYCDERTITVARRRGGIVCRLNDAGGIHEGTIIRARSQTHTHTLTLAQTML